MTVDWEALAELIRKYPEPTKREREAQALSFAYGNLALGEIESQGEAGMRKVSRAAFRTYAIQQYGWTGEEFDAWADAHPREWA